MGEARRLPFWKRMHTVSPGNSALGGAALGGVSGLLTGWDFFAPGAFALYLLCFVTFGGISGYTVWIAGDPARWERFARIWTLGAVLLHLGLKVAFPSLWSEVGRLMGAFGVVVLFGGINALAFIAVGAGWGVVHLTRSWTFRSWPSGKPIAPLRLQGVWDREHDPI